ncbi:MAG: hypothetical protein HY235_25420 [Acidobacteria bacterium]|nr:hypothetical protein [Acidobacteriota bacterium]
MKRHQVGGADLGKDRGVEAKRLAAAILEVLAGARTPTEAATALGLSVPRYYQLEAQALRGLLEACEPKPRGRVRSIKTEVETLSKENQRLQRELTRHQALARAAQRTVGLAPPAPVVNKAGKKPRKRRVARALSVAERLKEETIPTTGTPPTPASTAAI